MKRSGFDGLTVLLVRALALLLLASVAGAVSSSVHAANTPTAQKKVGGAPSASMHHPEHFTLTPSDLKWENAPATLPAGARIAVLEGDPSKTGPYTIRFQVPDGYKVMPHWHPTSEHLTVISGTFHVATGDTFDQTKGTELPVGGYA